MPRKKQIDPNIARPGQRRKPRAGAKEPEEPKIDFDKLPKLYKCSCCGTVYPVAEQRFFVIPQCHIYQGNDNYASMCTKCALSYYNEYTNLYGNQKFALLLICSMLGAYFSERLYESLAQKGEEVRLGDYLRYLNGSQYKNKTFSTYLLEMKNQDKAFIPADKMRELMEGSWSVADRRNMNYVKNTLGYDCFADDSYSSEDRRYLYNTMSGYMSDDVLEDPHKIMSVINIVKSSLQLAQCDILINKQMKAMAPDMDTIKSIADTKNGLQRAINAIAKENAISAVGSGKRTKSTLALTAIMKEMLDNNIDAVKPNLSDSKMEGAYKQIAQISAKALLAEMNFTSDDYAKMVADQSEIIAAQSEKIMEIEEINRLLSIQLDNAKRAGFNTQGTITIEAGVNIADSEERNSQGTVSAQT